MRGRSRLRSVAKREGPCPVAAMQVPQACRGGCRQDFSEKNISEAAIKARPRKNMVSTAKCRSAIHHDMASDIKAVSAGTKFQNIVTKPLSPPVTVREI